MKIYNKIVLDMITGEILEEDSFDYKGSIAQLDGFTIALIVFQVVLTYIVTSAMMPDDIDYEQPGIEVNTRSTKEPLQILYGKRKVAGNDVYMTSGGTKHKELFIVSTLSEGECEGIHQKEGVDQVWIDGKNYTKYGSKVSYTFYSGSDSQTFDSGLNTFDGEWTDNMRNVSYIVYELYWDRDKFRGIPKRQLILEGKHIKNLLNSDTVEYDNNPVNCLYDFMTSTRYGLAISESLIDKASFVETAQYCDDKGWELNLAIRPNTQSGAWSIVQDILKHFRGTLNWWDGKYYLRFTDLSEEASVFTIEDKHIFQTDDGRAEIAISQPSRFEKSDGISVVFYDETKEYAEDYITIGEETGVVEDVKFGGYTNRKMAADMGTYVLERKNLDRIISGTFRSDCIQLEPHDIITFNSTALAIEDQLMRVTDASANSDGSVNLTLIYESYSLYDDDYDDTIEDVYQVSLPDASEPSLISNADSGEEVYYYRLSSYSRLNITFTVPDEEVWFDHCEIWVSVTGDVDANYTHQFNVVDNFSIDPVEEGNTYWLKLRTVNLWGVKQELDHATKISRLIVGKSIVRPTNPNPLSVVPGTNALNLYSKKVFDPDIEHYEFRLGLWSGGVFLASLRSPNYSIQNIKPSEGTPFIFSLNTRSSNDLYGEIPRTASANVDYPTGYSSYDDDVGDYSTGSHTNTAEITGGLYDGYLETVSDSVSGTYISDIFDIGVLDTYYTWASGEIVVVGAGTIWDDQFPAPNTWDQGNVDRAWYKIFELDEAPSVLIRIGYKATVPAEWQYIDHAELIAGVVYARYFNIEIIINDPSEEERALIEPYILNFYSRD